MPKAKNQSKISVSNKFLRSRLNVRRTRGENPLLFRKVFKLSSDYTFVMAEKYIEWIGTGSGLNPVLGNTSFMVRGTDRTLLVDCGSTVPLELMKSGQIGDVTDIHKF